MGDPIAMLLFRSGLCLLSFAFLLWHKNYSRQVAYNPFNSLGSISSPISIVVSGFHEVCMILLVFLASDPYMDSNVLKILMYIFTGAWVIALVAKSHRSFQNIQSLEYFCQILLALLVLAEQFIYRKKI